MKPTDQTQFPTSFSHSASCMGMFCDEVRFSHKEDSSLMDGLLFSAFRLAVTMTNAEVGLLHRRTDACLYTIAVHGVDPNYHLHIWLSLWDPAVQWILCNKTLEGTAESGTETRMVSNRLSTTKPIRFILAIPVCIGDCVEAVIELGRSDSPFPRGMSCRLNRSVEVLAT